MIVTLIAGAGIVVQGSEVGRKTGGTIGKGSTSAATDIAGKADGIGSIVIKTISTNAQGSG